VGMIEAQLSSVDHAASDSARAELKAVEEYAAECSMVKVFAAEMLDYVADEGVQIHGGYGFHQDYMVERAYRDARINRLFEGTSEINRLVISGMPLKRASRGTLPLLDRARKTFKEALDHSTAGAPHADNEEMRLVKNTKTIALFALGVADARFGTELEKQQEIVMGLSDIFMETFAMESTLLRCRKLAGLSSNTVASAICSVFLRDAMLRIFAAAQTILGSCSSGGELQQQMSALRSLAAYDPVNAISLRRQIAEALLDSERYIF